MIALKHDLEAAGYRIAVHGDRIRLDFESPGEPDIEQVAPLLNALVAHKQEVLDFLRFQQDAAWTVHVEEEMADESEKRIWAENLLPDHIENEIPCYCCGRCRWWYKKGGEQICGVCHPQPEKISSAGEAAGNT